MEEELKNEIIVLKQRIAELEREIDNLRTDNERLTAEYNELLHRLLSETNKGGGYNW